MNWDEYSSGRVKNWFSRLFNSDMQKGFAFLGGAVSRLAGVLNAPIISRVCNSEQFGEFAVFSSFLAVINSLLTGRYEFVIITIKGD